MICLTAQTPFDKLLGFSNLDMLKYEWIWEKNKPTGHLNSKKMPMKAHENILIFYDNLPIYYPQNLIKKEKPTIRKGRSGNGSNYGISDKDAIQEYENYPRDVIYFKMDPKSIHPTQKPVELFEYLIKTYTNENDLILDNCAGSGTTGISALNTKRNFTLIEKDEIYYKVIIDRIIKHKENLERKDNG